MSDDLVAFLRARLDEDEAIAQTAIDPKHPGDWAWRKDTNTTVRTHKGVPVGPASRGVDLGPHIARWNPAHVLREVKAKRDLIVVLVALADTKPKVAALALGLPAKPYAIHPDFRDDWR